MVRMVIEWERGSQKVFEDISKEQTQQQQSRVEGRRNNTAFDKGVNRRGTKAGVHPCKDHKMTEFDTTFCSEQDSKESYMITQGNKA